jgi:radical SAM protein with 4Fe4S-binding SPASM domain
VPLRQFQDLTEIKGFFHRGLKEEMRKRQYPGIYPSCRSCRYRERNVCTGGCLAHAFADSRS